ncbi:hypothetical protein PG990_002394 [Apiospora arundinis]
MEPVPWRLRLPLELTYMIAGRLPLKERVLASDVDEHKRLRDLRVNLVTLSYEWKAIIEPITFRSAVDRGCRTYDDLAMLCSLFKRRERLSYLQQLEIDFVRFPDDRQRLAIREVMGQLSGVMNHPGIDVQSFVGGFMDSSQIIYEESEFRMGQENREGESLYV